MPTGLFESPSAGDDAVGGAINHLDRRAGGILRLAAHIDPVCDRIDCQSVCERRDGHIGKNAVRCSVEDADSSIGGTGNYVHRAPAGRDIDPVGGRVDREHSYPHAKGHRSSHDAGSAIYHRQGAGKRVDDVDLVRAFVDGEMRNRGTDWHSCHDGVGRAVQYVNSAARLVEDVDPVRNGIDGQGAGSKSGGRNSRDDFLSYGRGCQ